MLCRTHKESQANAICCACGAGICNECDPIEASGKLACCNNCAEIIKKESKAIDEILKKNRFGIAFMIGFLVISGIGFLSVGLLGFALSPKAFFANIFASCFGVLFVLFGVFVYKKNKSAA